MQITNRKGYSWGMLWELVRIHYLDPSQGITPKVCRNLMGKNAAVGPHVKAIVLDTKVEESSTPDPRKAEHDAQVRRWVLHLDTLG